LSTTESCKCKGCLSFPFYIIHKYTITVCISCVAIPTDGEYVVGLKATVAELQEQINTKDKTVEVGVPDTHIQSIHVTVLSTGAQ